MGSVTPAPAGASEALVTTSDPSRDRHESRLRTAIRYALIELARNRMAFGLLVVFVPLWYGLLALLVTTTPVAFQFNATGVFLQVNGRDITVLTAGYNAITLIVGFLIYSATRRGSRFDRRLTLAGYPQLTLVCAKLIALVVASVAIALYAALVMLVFWRPESFAVVWLGLVCAALAYGTLGLFLGVLVTSELAGFFVIIMVSLMDTFLQNPVENPVANKPTLRAFPSYGSMQIGVAGGFTSSFPATAALIALAWVVGFALLGLSVFWWRTRPRGQLRG